MARCDNCHGEYDFSNLSGESFRCLGWRYVYVCPECLRQLRQDERRFLENEKREKAEAERERKREEAEAERERKREEAEAERERKREEAETRESERQRRAALTPEERRAEDDANEKATKRWSILSLVFVELLAGFILYNIGYGEYTTFGIISFILVGPTVFFRKFLWPIGFVIYSLISFAYTKPKAALYTVLISAGLIVVLHDVVSDNKWIEKVPEAQIESSEATQSRTKHDYLSELANIKTVPKLKNFFTQVASDFEAGKMGISGISEQVKSGNKIMTDVYSFLAESVHEINEDQLEVLKKNIQNNPAVSDYRKKKALSELNRGLEKIKSLK